MQDEDRSRQTWAGCGATILVFFIGCIILALILSLVGDKLGCVEKPGYPNIDGGNPYND